MSSLSRRTLNSVTLTRVAQAVALALTATLVGCQSTSHMGDSESVRAHNYQARLKQKPVFIHDKPAQQAPDDVWERMRQGFKLQDDIGVNPRIEQQRLWFASNPSHLETVGDRGSLYMHYIVERLEERDMPLELALLPAIESAYNPWRIHAPMRSAYGSSSPRPGGTSTCAKRVSMMVGATLPRRPTQRWTTCHACTTCSTATGCWHWRPTTPAKAP